MKIILAVVLCLLLSACGGFADVKTASGFCVTSAGWNGAPVVAVGCNREKGTTGGGISIDCGGQYKMTCNDIEKGSAAPATPAKVTP